MRASGWIQGRTVVLALSLVAIAPVWTTGFVCAQEQTLQVFSGIEKTVVAVGEPLEYWAEVYVSVGSMAEGERLRVLVEEAPFDIAGSGAEVLQHETTAEWIPSGELGRPLTRISRKYLVRFGRPGVHTLPGFNVRLGNEAHVTEPQEVYSYRALPDFFSAAKVVFPVVVEREQGRMRYSRIGSAFLIAPDAVVTTYHILVDASEVRLVLPDGRRFATKKAWAVDPARDVAVLHVDPEIIERAGLAPLKLAPTGAVQDTSTSYAENVAFTYGWPSGIQRSTAGAVHRGLELQEGRQVWITSNPVRPGDSGGPLLDSAGRVIGVVTAGSALTSNPDVLREEVGIAADPRPVLAQMLVAGKPRLLKEFWDEGVAARPHARALRASMLLNSAYVGPALASEAVAEMDGAVQDAPGEAGLHFMQGSIQETLGRREEAADSYRRALDLSPDHFPAALMLGLYHLRKDAYAEAEDLLRRVRDSGAYRQLALYALAQAHLRDHDYRQAAGELRQVLQYDPAYAPAWFYLAYSYLALGEESRARQLHAVLQQLDPYWAAKLRQVIRNDIFRPRVLEELPRAAFRTIAPGS